MQTYSLYGLRLKSEWQFPCPEGTKSSLAEIELIGNSRAYFSVAVRELAEHADSGKWFYYARLREGSDYVRWSGLFEFLVSADGRRIAGHPLANSTIEIFHSYLLGQVLSFALIKQGIEPLHSTVAVIDGGAVGWVGDCGYGKSSLGAAFLQAGYPLLTDDLLVLKEGGKGFTAYPGIPRIKLFPEIAKRMLGDGLRGTPLNNLTTKLLIPLGNHQSYREPVPLKTLYVLTPPKARSWCKRMTFRRLSQRRALMQLLKNSFNTVITEPERLKRQFDFFAKIVSKVPIKTLSYPRSLESLPLVREAILNDLEGGDN
jgi:hypothetical protein